MNTVASHINEMQKIHEEFGAVFDLLISEQTGEKKEVCELYLSSFHSFQFVISLDKQPSLFASLNRSNFISVFVVNINCGLLRLLNEITLQIILCLNVNLSALTSCLCNYYLKTISK